MTTEKSKNIIVAGLWATSGGHYNSLPVDDRGFDTLREVFEKGGKFLIRKRTAQAIAGAKNPETTPVAYLEFVPKQAVEEFKANRKSNQKGL